MKKETIDTIIESLKATQGTDNDKFFTASLLLIAVLQEKSAYRIKKGRPVSSFSDSVDRILMLEPYSTSLNHTKKCVVSSEMHVARFINDQDRLYLEIESLFSYDAMRSDQDDADAYLDKEEFREALSSDLEFETFFTPFLLCAKEAENNKDRVLTILLGLIWCASQDEVNDEVSRFLAYLIHNFAPLTSKFDEDGILLAIPPEGHISRSKDRASSELLIKSKFWEARIEV